MQKKENQIDVQKSATVGEEVRMEENLFYLGATQQLYPDRIKRNEFSLHFMSTEAVRNNLLRKRHKISVLNPENREQRENSTVPQTFTQEFVQEFTEYYDSLAL